MKEQFTNTFKYNKWGCAESKSGIGSSLPYTVNFRKQLVEIINKRSVESIFDCSCGDWNWMGEIVSHLPQYVGNDIVQELIDQNNERYKSDSINFVCNDMLSQLKTYDDDQFDLVLCRHTLEHLPLDYCVEVVREITRVSKYSIITSSQGNNIYNSEMTLDGFRSRQIQLNQSPFVEMLGRPKEVFYDTVEEVDIKDIDNLPDTVYGFLF